VDRTHLGQAYDFFLILPISVLIINSYLRTEPIITVLQGKYLLILSVFWIVGIVGMQVLSWKFISGILYTSCLMFFAIFILVHPFLGRYIPRYIPALPEPKDLLERKKQIAIIFLILLGLLTISYSFFIGFWIIIFELPMAGIIIWLYYPIFTKRELTRAPIQNEAIVYIYFAYFLIQAVIFIVYGIFGFVLLNCSVMIIALMLSPIIETGQNSFPIPNQIPFSFPKFTNDVSKKIHNNGVITIIDIDKMNGDEFERFLKKLFEKMGYLADLTPHTGDFGADLILSKQSKQGEKISVQAKNWTNNVGNDAIQAVVGSLKVYKTQRGMVVTTSDFTKAAIYQAHHNDIELWNREKLKEMINKFPVYK
jgi:HJR/Mrr/RecB family endonuclease